MLVSLADVTGGLTAAAVAVAARQDGAPASFGLDQTTGQFPFIGRAAIERGVQLLAMAGLVLVLVGVLLVVAGAPLGLEELVDEALGLVGVLGGSRALGGDERALPAVNVAGFEGDLRGRRRRIVSAGRIERSLGGWIGLYLDGPAVFVARARVPVLKGDLFVFATHPLKMGNNKTRRHRQLAGPTRK